MLCEMGWEVRRYEMILVKLVVMESLGDHKLAKESAHYWTFFLNKKRGRVDPFNRLVLIS
ncbi:hypothetical protein C9J51_02400 [Photobacterium iliopiscarium]|jgi:hypothetical protein|nr:hypothetical protein UB38_06160 [Photobacterium iliopiscarium]PST99803.1 hypothetical protein C9I85_09470 [Photobacterium iliopiscarium]PSV85141.1 hypothetical protein C9J51_02400 [Photobacterium iliopiscarium]